MAHGITENDGMFSVIEKPWHGLGIVLDAPPTIEEAITTAKLNWEVEAKPLFTKEGFAAPAQGIVHKDTNDVLGVTGTRYEPLQNQEAFNIFQPLLDTKDIELETAGSLNGGRRVWILARIKTLNSISIGKKDDEVKPYVLLSNAHDGKQAVKLGFTPIRVVCNNTLTAAHKDEKSNLIRIAHLKNVHDATLELTNIMDLQKGRFEATIKQYRMLAKKAVSSSDLRRYVRLALSSHTEKIENIEIEVKENELKRTEQKVVEIFETGRNTKSTGKNLWRAYNAINEFLTYERGDNLNQSDRLYSLWFAEARRIDERAFKVALKLAA